MNERQKRFVEAYLIEPNATKAAEAAGYSQPHSQGPRLLENVEVKLALDEARKARAQRTQTEADRIIRDIRKIKKRCMEATPVRDMFGRVVEGKWTFDAKNALKALELLGKHFGLWDGEGAGEKKKNARIIITLPHNGRK